MLKRQSACNQFQRIGIKTITKSELTQLNQVVRFILYLLLINLGLMQSNRKQVQHKNACA
jgi:hypothetical protein